MERRLKQTNEITRDPTSTLTIHNASSVQDSNSTLTVKNCTLQQYIQPSTIIRFRKRSSIISKEMTNSMLIKTQFKWQIHFSKQEHLSLM